MNVSISRYHLFLLGAAARVGAALTSTGFDHPNEAGRLLEPLAHMAGFGAALPWEWTQGLLSQLPVRALSWVTLIEDPWLASVGLRVLVALLSMSIPWATYRIVRRFDETSAQFALMITLFWPELLYQSARLMDYNFEASLTALALGVLVSAQLRPVLAGLFMALAFFVRPQSALTFIGLACFAAFQGKPGAADIGVAQTAAANSTANKIEWSNSVKSALLFGGTYLILIASLAALESAWTGDVFLGWFRRYWEFNITQQGGVQNYGRDPWHRYFTEAAKYWGILGFFPLFLFSVLPIFSTIITPILGRPLIEPSKMDVQKFLLAWIWILPFCFLSILGHKEGRFLYGFLWVMVPSAWSLVSGVRLSRLFRTLFLALFLGSFAINGTRVASKWRTLSAVTYEWSQHSVRAASSSPKSSEPLSEPLVIPGDPDFLPGGFFLRHPGPICYVPAPQSAQMGRTQAGCKP